MEKIFKLSTHETAVKELYKKNHDRIKHLIHKKTKSTFNGLKNLLTYRETVDEEGVISWKEFQVLTENLGEKLNEEEAKEMLKEMDTGT